MKKPTDIVFCKPNKGNGTVILNKEDYTSKVKDILSDVKKFKKLPDDPTDKREARLQQYLRVLKNKDIKEQHS